MTRPTPRLTSWLQAIPPWGLTFYAIATSFSTYFCMYAFRKPFSAGEFKGETFLGDHIELKTAFVISQIIGYALSKFIGIKICSEVSRGKRASTLILMIVLAQLALLLFAVVPNNFKVLAMLLNGLPLGMVWGITVRYLEGRRTSEILLAGLSCSFIVSSGTVKQIAGRAVTEMQRNFGSQPEDLEVAIGPAIGVCLISRLAAFPCCGPLV